MPRFAANVSMLFTEVPFLERFALAAQCGFGGAECQFPYEAGPDVLSDKVAMSNIPLVLFNAPAGNTGAGERGIAALKGREKEFRASVETALRYAEHTDCKQVHFLTGIVPEGEQEAALEVLLKNLDYAARTLAPKGIRVLVENINLPDYITHTPSQAAAVVRAVDHKNVKLQYDIYRAQMTEGGITAFLEQNMDIIGHIQVAGVPNRDEPDLLGELNWGYLFNLLDAHGYDGWVAAEYEPRGGTLLGLKWGRDWGIAAPAEAGTAKR